MHATTCSSSAAARPRTQARSFSCPTTRRLQEPTSRRRAVRASGAQGSTPPKGSRPTDHRRPSEDWRCKSTPRAPARLPRCNPRGRSPSARPPACPATTSRTRPATLHGGWRCARGPRCRPRQLPWAPPRGSPRRRCSCPRVRRPMSRRPSRRRRPLERGCSTPSTQCPASCRSAPPCGSNRRRPAPTRGRASPRASKRWPSCRRSGSPASRAPRCHHAPMNGSRRKTPERGRAGLRPGPSRTAARICAFARPRRRP
mmetsp:Transcript_9858/g.28040  ORF Transcript_9858/g.28040 Transcript_9858/m.28040 type:complete len:257 (-) Transcript_9858:238-1008(-)